MRMIEATKKAMWRVLSSKILKQRSAGIERHALVLGQVDDDEELLFAITTCFTKRGTTITLKYGGISSILTLFCDNENRNSKGIYVEPLNDEEIISDKIDASIISSPKIDSFLEQFSGELAHIDLIPREVNEAQLDPEG
ncbi:hypothetical protein Tco_1034750 [Tanacetum coccineum]